MDVKVLMRETQAFGTSEREVTDGTTGRRPSPAVVLAVLALVAAVSGTAIADQDVATKAVSVSKVKRIAKKQANRQIKLKAMRGPGRVITVIATPDVNDPDNLNVLRVPGLVSFQVTCDPGQMTFRFMNLTDADMRFSGSDSTAAPATLFNRSNIPPDNAFGFVGGTSQGHHMTVHAIAATGKAVSLNVVIHPKLPSECPVSAQAVVTG
jgi:hypothetical protein